MSSHETYAKLKEFFEVDLFPITRRPVEIPDTDRVTLAEAFAHCGFTTGAEIGVETGKYSQVLLDKNPQLSRLHLVDAWQAYKGYRDHVTQGKCNDLLRQCEERLAAYEDRVKYWCDFSVKVAPFFADELDFVYIDANHDLPHVIADIDAWARKVRPGGIVAGHDYCKRKQSGYQVHVVEAVHAWTSAYHIKDWYVLGSKEVRDGERRDRPRSWFWVKE